MNQSFTITEPSEFTELIKELMSIHAESSAKNLVVALSGDLGAGKTTCTQALAKYLGVSEVVTSPTFTIMKQYLLENQIFSELIHIDAYRIESEDEVRPLGLEEIMNREGVVVCVEWPEKILPIIPTHAIQLRITINEDESRLITIGGNK